MRFPRLARGRFGLGLPTVFRGLVMAFVAVAATVPSLAWKPKTHILAANLAIETIIAGNDYVTIQGENYAVDPRVAEAIRNHPNFYRSGVAGPDLYPDMYVGQAIIHPDNKLENGSNPPGDFSAGHSFSYEWLRHIFEGAWQYYNDRGGDSEGQKILAFGYGYLTHGAGDMWAHTLVNSFAKGWFPSWTDIANADIAIRHIIFESGYIGEHTPDTTISIANNDATLSEFIHWTMIAGGKDGGFIDSANNDTWALGHGVIFGFFLDLRWALFDRSEALQGLGPLNPIYWLTEPLWLYMDAWVDDIDTGLEAWPYMSQEIGANLVGEEPMDWSGAGEAIEEYVLNHVLSMIGFPDWLGAILDYISDITEAFFDLLEPIIEPLKNAATELRNWVIKTATGIDVEELKDYLTSPETYINSPLFDAGTQDKIDGLMGITPGSDEKFSTENFKAFKNTVTTSKLVLMTPDSLNKLLYDHRVGPLFQEGSMYSDRDNFMLGFIRTLDGHEQWRKSTAVTYPNSPAGSPMGEGMPIWVDCLARDRVFRSIFEPWEGQDFDDHDELGEDLAATPPPTSTISVLGPEYASGGTTFIGGTSKIRISSAPDHYWNADEISVEGSIAPGGISDSGASPIDLGPIGGADGVYTVTYNANGDCISGPPHGETDKTKAFTLDATPPTVDITPPAAGLILDVSGPTSTTGFDFTASDGGSGIAEDSEAATLDGVPILGGATIDAFFLTAGTHTLIAKALDNIGNEGTDTVTFKVEATIQGLKGATTRAYALKLVTIPIKDLPLQAKLDSAQKSLLAGKIGTCKNSLSALANQVTKYIGTGVDPAFGNRYVGWINDLISRL